MYGPRQVCDCQWQTLNEGDLARWVPKLRQFRSLRAAFSRHGWRIDYTTLCQLLLAPHSYHISTEVGAPSRFHPDLQRVGALLAAARKMFIARYDNQPHTGIICTALRRDLASMRPG